MNYCLYPETILLRIYTSVHGYDLQGKKEKGAPSNVSVVWTGSVIDFVCTCMSECNKNHA